MVIPAMRSQMKFTELQNKIILCEVTALVSLQGNLTRAGFPLLSGVAESLFFAGNELFALERRVE